MAGLIVGGVFTLLIVLYFVFVIIVLAALGSSISNLPSNYPFPTS